MPKLIIITPVTRPSNLPAIYNNLLSYVGREFSITWYVIFDKRCEQDGREWKERFSRSGNPNLTIISVISDVENAVSGNAHRNQVLTLLEKELEKHPELSDHWTYFLDDNNILHPDFCKLFQEGGIGKAGLLFFRSTSKKGLSFQNFDFEYFNDQIPQHLVLRICLSFFCVRFIYLCGL